MSTRFYDSLGNVSEGDFNFSYSNGVVSVDKEFSATKVHNAIWNDLADAIEVPESLALIPGRCYAFEGDNFYITTHYGELGVLGIHSDTAGYILGLDKSKHQLYLAVAGFVMAYCDRAYPSGTPLVATEDGYLTEANEDILKNHPDRIIAKYLRKQETDEYQGLKVDGRHWVRVI